MVSNNNADRREIERFDQISRFSWDPNGEMGTLHAINPLRLGFILENNILPNPRILDVGCGGGILAEALAKAGGRVTGIDLSQASIQVAIQHAHAQGLEIDYLYWDIEDFTQLHVQSFDIVTCMEMLEHVPHPEKVIGACAQALKSGGQAFFSTINRTLKAYLFAVLIGEYVLHLLPRGSHKYHRLIQPQEMKNWAGECDLEFVRLASLMYNPLTRKFNVAENKEDVNYMLQFVKRK